MYKLTIIATLVIGSMAFAQSGKGDHTKGGGQGNKSSSTKLSGANHKVQPNVTHNDQKGKENKGGSKAQTAPSNQKSSQQGSHGKSAPKSKHSPSKFVAPQGKGQNGNKPAKYNGSSGGANKAHYSEKQGKKQNGHDQKGKAPKYKYDKGHYSSKGSKGHNKHYAKGHPNFGYIYINTPGHYSHKNYGQWRSNEAKKKHKHYHPIYEYQAIEGFNLIIVRNNFLYTETHDKIILVRRGLARQRSAGTITFLEYTTSMSRVYVLEQRRAALEINIIL